MTVLLSPVQLADIERQKADWPECPNCLPDMPGWMLSGGNERKLPDGRWVWKCNCNPNLTNLTGRIPQPVYIVGEGMVTASTQPAHPGSNLPGTSVLPPTGWPAVGERVQCETCGGIGGATAGGPAFWRNGHLVRLAGPNTMTRVACHDCNGEGATLPRVELTVTCEADDESCPHPPSVCRFNDCDGTVPWGSALWQTLPVVECQRRVIEAHCVEVVTDKYVRMWHECVPDATHDRWMHKQLPLDPASVRPGSFVAMLTDIEQA